MYQVDPVGKYFYIKYKLVTEFWKNTCYFCDVKWRYLNWNEILGNAGLVVPPLVVAEAEMNIDCCQRKWKVLKGLLD